MKLDTTLLRFFQSFADCTQKVGIPLGVLINVSLAIQLMALIGQIICLYTEGSDAIVMFLKAFPTILVIFYLRYLIRNSKKGAVRFDLLRVFSFTTAMIVTFYFTYTLILRMILGHMHFLQAVMYVKSELVYTIAYITFFIFLYFLACTPKVVARDIKSIKE